MIDFGYYLVHRRCPDERFWIFVIFGDVVVNGGNQFLNASERSAPGSRFFSVETLSVFITAVGLQLHLEMV